VTRLNKLAERYLRTPALAQITAERQELEQKYQTADTMPPESPEPRRVDGGVGAARRYRPPRPASRRRPLVRGDVGR
jgi:hypothetical protein